MKKICYKIFLTLINTLLFANLNFAQPCSNPTTSNCADAIAGSSKFIMSTSANVDFNFSDMQKFVTGITHSGSTQLRLKIDEIVSGSCKWKLIMYINNNGHLPANEWENLNYYGTSGDNPELGMIQVNVYNGCGTPLNSGTYQTFIGNTQYDIIDIIPNLVTRNMPGSCDGTPVNGPGSYLSDYNEYNFTVDYRIAPNFKIRPGAYQIKIHFCLVEVP